MITIDEYNNAITIINRYHKQVEDSIKENQGLKKTSLPTWIRSVECSRRLYNVLTIHMNSYQWVNGETIPANAKYIEDIDINKLRKERNCGEFTVKEFIELRGY